MGRNKENVAVSALYTAAVWQWAKLPSSDLLTPEDSNGVFRLVNAYMRFYRWINPAVYSLPHQLLHRHSAINYLLRQAACPRVVEVACGFSPRGVTLSENAQLEYYDFDLPAMLRQ